MNHITIHKRIEIIFTLLFFTGVFIFFALFYNNFLHFEEQMQLFLLTGVYFLESIKVPGGFIGYIGEFITQFFYISIIGSLFITLLLFCVQQLSLKLLYAVKHNTTFFPFSFILPLISWVMLCDEYYMISGVVGLLVALLLVKWYISIGRTNLRALTGLFLIPVSYMLCGGAYMAFVAIISAYELLKAETVAEKSVSPQGTHAVSGQFQRINIWYLIAFALLAFIMPLITRRFFIQENTLHAYMSEFYYNILSINLITPIPPAIFFSFISLPFIMVVFRYWIIKEKRKTATLAFTLIVLVGLSYFSLKGKMNFSKEEIMTYDYLSRNEQWFKIIEFAEKKPPRHYMSLNMLNLALAKTGLMPERMFHYSQSGSYGLILPFTDEYGFPISSSEVFYHLGLINAAQHYAFESLTLTPNNKQNVRSIKRLSETNLINGHYEVAEKYLNLLEETLFYRKWAKEKKKLLYNEELIDNDPVYGEKRKHLLKNDFFLNVDDMETALENVLAEDPQNKMAFEYLMAYYLVNKDLKSFVDNLYRISEMRYTEIPKSYQEAIYFVESLPDFNMPADRNYPVSFDVMNRMLNYKNISSNHQDAQSELKNLFSDTYWYYLDFM